MFDHRVQRGQEQHREARVRPGRARRRHCLAPDVLLQAIHLRERGLDGGRDRDLPVDVEPRLQIAAKAVAERRLQIGRDQVDPQIGGADRVGLLDDQVPPPIEAVRGPGEGERDQQPQEGEDRALDRPDALARSLRILSPSAQTDSPAPPPGAPPSPRTDRAR
jgi:hypothetical protein